ncbi:MAG: rhomboid family intramembrane serine protease [Tepidiformaceae bacterium]
MEAVLLFVMVTGSAAGGVLALKAQSHRLRFPLATVALVLVTFVLSAVGNSSQSFLDALARDRSQLLDGEWWRLATPLFVQDGGWPGTTFNVVSLLVLGSIVESTFGRRAMLAVYFTAGLVSEAFAYTLLQGQGFAGNSVAVMGLAGLLTVALLRSRILPLPARANGAFAAVAGSLLVATANLHGVGFAVGVVAAIVVPKRPFDEGRA